MRRNREGMESRACEAAQSSLTTGFNCGRCDKKSQIGQPKKSDYKGDLDRRRGASNAEAAVAQTAGCDDVA
jgi:hypothetical protein